MEAFAVHRHGGSIGSGGPVHVKTHETKEDAKEHAKRLNKGLSPGEKSYYGIKYKVSEVKGDVKENLDEGTNIPVSRATDAVSKVLGQKGAVNFLAKLKPGNKTHTSWNEVNGALVDQGTQSAHIAKVAGHLKPTQYNEAED
jgi:hypothetical protein